jgi:hypothetical protein
MNRKTEYFDACEYSDKYIEVALTDLNEVEYFYWVNLQLISQDEDKEDRAIELAKIKHMNLNLPKVLDNNNSELIASAYNPFSRNKKEFTFID